MAASAPLHPMRRRAAAAVAVAAAALAGAALLEASVAAASVHLQPQRSTWAAGAAGGPLLGNSPALARNPRRPGNLVAVGRVDPPGYSAGLAWSDDGGRTWGHTRLPLPAGVTAEPFDPDAAFAPDGTLYVAYLNLHGRGHTPEHLWLSRSTDGGRSLAEPIAAAGSLAFQPRLTAGAQEVVITYLQAAGIGQLSLVGPAVVDAVTSTDGGVSVSPPVPVSDASRVRVGGAVPVIGSDGSVVVVYEDFKGDLRDFLDLEGPVWPDHFALVVSRSSDGGAHFSRGRELESHVAPVQRFLAAEPPYPSVAAGPGSALAVAWADGGRGGSAALLRLSGDLGATWSPPQPVGGAGSGQVHRLPTVGMAPDGRIDLLDLDNRRDPGGPLLDVWLASSRDGGHNFTQVRLSTTAVDPRAAPSLGSPEVGPDLGSRLGLASDRSAALAAWPGSTTSATGMLTGASAARVSSSADSSPATQGVAVAEVAASVPGALLRSVAAAVLLVVGVAAAAVAFASAWPARALAVQSGAVALGAAALRGAAWGRAAVRAPRRAPPPVPAGTPHLRVGARAYPVLLPSLRDPRLHVAAALLSVQVLGQVALGFQLSVAQILLAMGLSAITEVVITFVQQRRIIWPASALLTGNGVALIMRTPGTVHGDWWSLHGAAVFIAATLASLLSKYVLRIRGRHLFNPSNVGLVLSFVLFGSALSDPQELWWGPLSPGLGVTIAIIVVGGLLIVRRLRMLPMALAFMASFTACFGLITLSGHCISARWHLGPVCGEGYWSVLVSSPEILIFMFFMITDPQTSPRHRSGRILYGAGVGFAGALLAAPLRTEFSTKVAILGGLVLVCALMPVARRILPPLAAGASRLLDEVAGAAARRAGGQAAAAARTAASGGAAVLAAAVCAGVLLLATIPAQHSAAAGPQYQADASRVAARPVIPVEAASLPPVEVDPAVLGADPSMSPAKARAIALDVVQDLLIEARALESVDGRLAATAAVGPMLQSAVRAIAAERQAGSRTVPSYRFTALRLVLARNPADYQASLEVTVEVRATVTSTTYTGLTGNQAVGRAVTTMHRILAVQAVGGHQLLAGDYTR